MHTQGGTLENSGRRGEKGNFLKKIIMEYCHF